MRNRTLLALLVIASLASSGCTASAKHAASSTGAASNAASTIPAGTLQAIADYVGAKSLAGATVTTHGTFTEGAAHFTVATVNGAPQLMPTAEIKSAADYLVRVLPTPFVFNASLSGSVSSLGFTAKLNTEPYRYVMFVSPANLAQLATDMGRTTAAAHGALTARQLDGKRIYSVSFVSDLGDKHLYGQAGVSINSASTYVELCQNLLDLSADAITMSALTSQPGWAALSQKAKDADILGLKRIGQEVTCNSFGAALAFARAGVPYTTYERIAGAATLSLFSPIVLPLIVFAPDSYRLMKG